MLTLFPVALRCSNFCILLNLPCYIPAQFWSSYTITPGHNANTSSTSADCENSLLQSPLWHLLSAQVGSQHVVPGFQSDPQTFLWTWAGDERRLSVSSWWWRWRWRGVSRRPPATSRPPCFFWPEPFLSVHTTGVWLRMWYQWRRSSQSTFSSVSFLFSF